ncbi:MAG: M28 family metallopeptidase [Candidatus Bathyarchaeia archaeon]
MVKRIRVFPFLFLIIALLMLQYNGRHAFGFQGSLNSIEGQIVGLVNGTRAYGYDLALEEFSLAYPDFRSSGSSGAYEAAVWIKEQFESFGLNAWLEPFTFVNWTLDNKPLLVIDEDGNNMTSQDQTVINSFQSEHYSWPLSLGAFKDLVVLPLPPAANYEEVRSNSTDPTVLWNLINTTDKIVLIGKEVRWNSLWEQKFIGKISVQRPASVIFTWWYNWMNFTPPMHSSAGGLPLSLRGAYFWDLQIPVGFVAYADGLMIRQKEEADPRVSAYVEIKARIGQNGTHYNVVGKIEGASASQKIVIVSAHYDTVMCCGFCDNGAGVAGLIELAKVISQAMQEGLYQPAYTILFVAFAGEELYLVGSAHFVKEHKSEMANIEAVINLDCIGSDNLYVTETPNSQLAQKIIEAAQDLGVTIATEDPGGSDQESFRIPADVNSAIQWFWRKDVGISDASSVASSVMLCSYPLFYSDLWDRGTPGWIHTSYDNSTSTETLNWVESDELENHIKVALLTLIRVSPNLIPELQPSEIIVVLMVGAVSVCLTRKKIIKAIRKRESSV